MKDLFSRVCPSALTILLSCALLAFVSGCGSGKEATKEATNPTASTTPSANSTDASAASNDVSNWVETEPAPATIASSTIESNTSPDAVIGGYQRDCPKGTQTPECHARRLDVEAVFLDALTGLRTAHAAIDPRWYRLAAASETPQLTCLGVVNLLWDPKRTPEDDALIARALESPYRSVRGAVVFNPSLVPARLTEWMQRSSREVDYDSLTGVCMDNLRDAVPGTKWAGGYPSAQFRPWASDDSRRWFTTPDSVEKVVAWFQARGKSARTAQEMAADGQAKLIEQMTKLSQNPGEDNTKKIMALMANQGSASADQWSEPFRGMEGTGEIKYVTIAANQSIAIFRDDVLDATSIVAIRPKEPEPVDLTPDVAALTEEGEMRGILGY